MSKPADDDFVMYLNSGYRGTHPLEPGVTTVRSAFRQELEIPLSLSPDWQVTLFNMYYTHSFGNAVVRSPDDFHCEIYRFPSGIYQSTYVVCDQAISATGSPPTIHSRPPGVAGFEPTTY